MSSPVVHPHLIDRLAKRPVLALFLLCLIAWLPGFASLPPLDRDESRFAQSSKQMIESGDYVDIRFTTVPRYNKPVGIYWLQAASALLLGHPPYNQIWTYRIPSLIGAFLAVLLCYWCVRALAPPPTALIAAALLALTVSLTAEAKIAKTDATLLATILAAQGMFLRAYLFARNRLPDAPPLWMTLAGWAAIGFGILLKGPVILAVLGLTAIVLSLWDRDWRWLRHIRADSGVPVMLAIVLPWAIAIAVASHGAFYQQSLGHDFAAKIVAGQETHGGPPGYYLALASVTLWPVTLFALPAIGTAIAQRTEPAIRYLLCWIAPTWLMFELVPTKLPHYILPIYPALAILAALWLAKTPESPKLSWQRALRIVACAQFVLVAIGFAAACALLPGRFGNGTPAWMLVIAMAGGLAAIAATIFAIRRRLPPAMMCAIVAALIFYPLATAGLAPLLGPIWMSPHLAALVAKDRRPGDPPIVLAGYVEPSLVFLLGTGTRIENGTTAAGTAAKQGGLALIDDHERNHFLDILGGMGATASPVDGVTGFNYSHGRAEHVTIYRVTPAATMATPPR